MAAPVTRALVFARGGMKPRETKLTMEGKGGGGTFTARAVPNGLCRAARPGTPRQGVRGGGRACLRGRWLGGAPVFLRLP